MMVVVVIIGLFAALAAPSVTSLVKDQRTRRGALNILNYYRDARSRALGRGAAINVVYSTTGYPWSFTISEAQSVVTEAQAVATPPALPDARCGGYDWSGATAGQTPVVLQTVLPGTGTGAAEMQVTATYSAPADLVSDTQVNAGGYLEVCFAPSGNVYYRLAANGTFNRVNGRVLVNVQRLESGAPIGIIRTIEINANGTTRVQL